MFYLEHLLKKYGQAIKKETKPKDSVVSVKFKPGMKPEPKPLHETIDLSTGKPIRSTYAPGGPKAKKPAEVKVVEKVKEKVWDIPSEFWKKKLSNNELNEVNSMIDKAAQDSGVEEHFAEKEKVLDLPKTHWKKKLSEDGMLFKNDLKKEALAPGGLFAKEILRRRTIEHLRKNPKLWIKDALKMIKKRPAYTGYPRAAIGVGLIGAGAGAGYYSVKRKKETKKSDMNILNSTIEKIAKMGVRAPGTPKKVEKTYEAIREDPKARKWISKHPYKGRSAKSSAAAIAWSGYKKSKKANYDVPTILEKIGAAPNLVSTAKELERLSETAGRKTLLDFWQRLGRAALSAKIMATPQVRKEMMREKAVAGGAIGAPIGGLVGYAIKPTIGGTLAGAAIGGLGAGTLGAYLAKRKSEKAESLLKDPMAQRALVSELARSIREKRPAELL